LSNLHDDILIELNGQTLCIPKAVSEDLAVSGIACLEWQVAGSTGNESNSTNANACIKYLETHILTGQSSEYLRIYNHDSSRLNTRLGDRIVKGTYTLTLVDSDAQICSCMDEDIMNDVCHVMIKLQKPGCKQSESKEAQLQLLAADKRSSYSVISVLTDLKDYLKIFWIEKDGLGAGLNGT
jgi:hypothetical protein